MAEKNNMPLSVEELSKMNAFESLWNCSMNHLNDVALTYSVDLKVDNTNSKPIVKKITYKQLIENILKTYKSLKDHGVKSGDVITFSSITTPELIYTAYASIMLGSIFKPIDVRFNSEDLLKQFKNTESKLFFCSEPFLSRVIPIQSDIGVDKIIVMNFKESLPKIIKLASKLQKNESSKIELKDKTFTNWQKFSFQFSAGDIPKNMPGKDEIIHFTATTGTTGEPKTLLHNSSNWNAQLYNASYSDLDFKRGERFFNCTVPWVDFGIINAIHIFLCNGIVMNLDPLWSPEKNADYIIKYNPNWWMGAPGWLDDLFTNEKYNSVEGLNAKYFITGGAPLYPHKHLLYQERLSEMSKNGRITPGYGFSEASAAVTTDTENKPDTIGRMWPLINAELRDYSTGKVVDDGQEGELWISSKREDLTQISPGYYNNEEKTKEIFVTDEKGIRWVRSGDKVRKNTDGTYTWISRYKNILTYNGYNIDCEKISDYVSRLDDVTRTAIIGSVASDGNQMPVICVEKKEESIITDEELKNQIQTLIGEKFPDYYKPAGIVVYQKFPTISMKIDVQALKRDVLNENGEFKVLDKEKTLTKK